MPASVRSAFAWACAVLSVLGCALPAFASEMTPWPPRDPGQPRAKVAITTTWAAGLRDIRDFAGLQRAVGSPGRLLAVDDIQEVRRAVFGWEGRGGRGHMRAFLYPSGDFAVAVTPADGPDEIRMNNAGAFVCPACSPPVHACGHRPSWVSHEVHWDGSDCHCTITGPQTIRPGAC